MIVLRSQIHNTLINQYNEIRRHHDHKGIKQLCAEAESIIDTWTIEQVHEAMNDEDVVLVDIRDIRELWRDGAIPGAIHAPRGVGVLGRS